MRHGGLLPTSNSAPIARRKGGQKEKAVPLITRLDKTETRAAASPQHAFKVNVPIDLSLVFKGWGPFPAVVGVQNQTGAWDHVGASRNPVLSDQTTANETLTEYTVGHSFACEVTGFTNILGRLVE